MEPKDMARQMIEFNKITFDSGFNAMVMVQEQTEKMVNGLMQQATWLPDEGKRVLNEWADTFKKGRNEFRSAVDESFKKAEAYFSQAGKTGGGSDNY